MILVLITIFANIVIICKGCLINSNDFYISVKKRKFCVNTKYYRIFLLLSVFNGYRIFKYEST